MEWNNELLCPMSINGPAIIYLSKIIIDFIGHKMYGINKQ